MSTPNLGAHLPEIVALIILIAASAFFSGSETAVISLSRLRARGMVDRGLKGSKAVMRLLDDRNRFLTSILIGNTIVLLAAGSLATVIFVRAGIPNPALWSTALMTVLLLTFGEIIPKTVAVADNERWALRLAPVLEKVAWVMTPLSSAFLYCTNLIVRFFGIQPSAHGPFVTEDDIRNIVNVGAEQKVLEEQEREMIHSIIQFGDTIVREVMTPRTDMVAVEVNASARRALDLVIADGYSKLPVYEDNIDTVIGVIHDRELLIALSNGTLAQTPIRALMRPITLVPESKRVSELLREMQRGKFSLAIVVDEYGGTAGLVTMEDLLEEIVGEIRDEHDEGEEEPIRIVSENEAVVDAGTNIEDVNARLGLHLPHEDFETIGGLTVGLFGRLPHEGEEVDAGHQVRLKIDRTRGRRILSVRIFKNGKHESAARENASENPDEALQ
ncbi:MAG TPA: hemolysin family protein, partial [Candidatus Baltobacteraceae bacterium]|nr:hemolysin family protein [Candidatus Baltobacteraceae bacterium]